MKEFIAKIIKNDNKPIFLPLEFETEREAIDTVKDYVIGIFSNKSGEHEGGFLEKNEIVDISIVEVSDAGRLPLERWWEDANRSELIFKATKRYKNKFFSFKRLKVKITKQHLRDSPVAVSFTVMNRGKKDYKLSPKIVLKCLSIPLVPKFPYGKKRNYSFLLNNSDNSLPSHTTKKFKAIGEYCDTCYFSNFIHYKFYSNKESSYNIYFLKEGDKPVSSIEFYVKRFLYRFFGVGLMYKFKQNEEGTTGRE